MDYPAICKDAFALVDDIGKGVFNNESNDRKTLATIVEVAEPILEIFRQLNPNDPDSVADAQSRLFPIASSEHAVFSRYPALTSFALGRA